jgi:hypothetical protein
MKVNVSWCMTPCQLVDSYQPCTGACWHKLQDLSGPDYSQHEDQNVSDSCQHSITSQRYVFSNYLQCMKLCYINVLTVFFTVTSTDVNNLQCVFFHDPSPMPIQKDKARISKQISGPGILSTSCIVLFANNLYCCFLFSGHWMSWGHTHYIVQVRYM